MQTLEIKRAVYVVEVMNGPLDGKRWEFSESATIGRDAGAVEIALPVDKAISRCHARLESKGGQLLITDLASSNGTLLNDVRISGSARLSAGEPFTIGRTMLRVLDGPCDGADTLG